MKSRHFYQIEIPNGVDAKIQNFIQVICNTVTVLSMEDG